MPSGGNNDAPVVMVDLQRVVVTAVLVDNDAACPAAPCSSDDVGGGCANY